MAGRETSQVIDAKAADWAARVDRGPLSAPEQSALDAWLAGDSRRLGAYAKARAVFAHVQRARALGPGFDAADFAEPPPARAVPSAPSRRRVLWLGGGAAAAAVVAVGGGLRLRGDRFQTRLGEVRLVPLADGSSITLNTASRVAVAFSRTERRVRLIEGEALFEVAKDPARPFLVEAGDTQVRAIGTSFTVRCLADSPVQVLVRQGVVEVKHGLAPAAAPAVRVAANTRAVASADGAVAASSMAPSQVTRELVWREGLLAFEDVTLEQAAAEFARYSDTRIVIDDPAVARETVTGLFSSNNPSGFAKAVASTLDLRAEAAPGQVRLSR
jgi:transmembrane sensor